MLAATAFSRESSSSISSRVFVYEVSGLSENDRTFDHICAIRESGSCFFQVPFSEMNHMMKRLNRLGGTIVSIQPLESFKSNQATSTDSTATTSSEGGNSAES